MNNTWLSEAKIGQKLEQLTNKSALAEHYWLSQYYQRAVFNPTYEALESLSSVIRLTEHGTMIVDECCKALGIPHSDATLALYGHYFHHDILVDYETTDVSQVLDLLRNDLLHDFVRFPFIWGRELYDKFTDRSDLSDLEELSNEHVWELLAATPIGVFQHGCFVSGPLGIIRGVETRWLPVIPAVERFSREGTKVTVNSIRFLPAKIKVVAAYAWIEQRLTTDLGSPSEWRVPLSWLQNRQRKEHRTDYSDICQIVGDCVLNRERTLLLERVFKLHDSIKNVTTPPLWF